MPKNGTMMYTHIFGEESRFSPVVPPKKNIFGPYAEKYSNKYTRYLYQSISYEGCVQGRSRLDVKTVENIKIPQFLGII